jgi:hypothetical protein
VAIRKVGRAWQVTRTGNSSPSGATRLDEARLAQTIALAFPKPLGRLQDDTLGLLAQADDLSLNETRCHPASEHVDRSIGADRPGVSLEDTAGRRTRERGEQPAGILAGDGFAGMPGILAGDGFAADAKPGQSTRILGQPRPEREQSLVAE